jgi:hypothetical protein
MSHNLNDFERARAIMRHLQQASLDTDGHTAYIANALAAERRRASYRGMASSRRKERRMASSAQAANCV